MSAVIGGDEAAVVSRLHELDLTPANYNGGGQLVAAGALDALQALSAEPTAGTRVIPLQVAGAFHTRFMAPAVETLREAASGVSTSDPGPRLDEPGRLGGHLRRGVPRPAGRPGRIARALGPLHGLVRRGRRVGLVELSPAGTLTGLAKRALRGVPAVAVKTPNDLEAAAALLNGASA